ncbi:hypothetical protein MUCCIDRAFT_86847 [Mucor lusitanicus CBS 277.49]|uniref:S-adenosyl-L-methionine-dependent methyltransferase n=1 Tax=Mucor lusitanicus CBS 277.49 TaxID=747725 RepID=A0A168GL17_MUCCL|nr:hypothetical protein MUCCIDRAFT_86847 [Mucor lusitanicus CBS 277.49]
MKQHYALNIAQINAQVVEAFDVNEIANKVYQHNFKHTPSKQKTIDRLTVKDIDRYKATCWLLSPPCQPYTNGGRKKDTEDPRAKALLHLIDLLPQLNVIPKYIFLENVKNFETSQSRNKLVEQLDALGYEINEYLLTPTQFGIPNHRMRYYLTARRSSKPREKTESYIENSKIQTEWMMSDTPIEESDLPSLSQFLEEGEDVDIKKWMVPERFILRLYKFRLDIVRPTDKHTSCVTKAYGSHHIQTSGSLVQTKDLECTDYNWDDTPSLLSFGLRFLSPTEVSRLHAFPGPAYQLSSNDANSNSNFSPPTCEPHLEFPQDVSQIQQYRLLGNSLNCWVVAKLYQCALFA